MWSTREKATTVLDALPKLPPLERLDAIRELLWRWEIQLEPLSPLETTSSRLEQEASDILDRIDCQEQKADGEEVLDADWRSVREAWIAVGLALVTGARLRFDEAEFNRKLGTVLPYQEENADVFHYIRHEQCLWSIFSLEFASLANQLDEWDVEGGDPVWMMRKAALLFEMGEDEKAQRLNVLALERSRQTDGDVEDIGMLSREAWALYCAGATLEYDEFWYASIKWRQRWDRLTPVKCNAPMEMRRYAEAIAGESKPEKGRPFELGNVWRRGFSFSQGEYLRWAAAHRAVRLPEVVGLPPTVRDRTVAAKNLELAARQLVPHEYELSARLVLRATKHESNGTLNVVLSRMNIAMLQEETACCLADICLEAIEYMLPRINGDHFGRHWQNRLAVIMEALSRFTLRLDANKVANIFDRTIAWYQGNVISKDILLAAPMWGLLSRSWEALAVEARREKIIEVLGASVIGLDGFSSGRAGDYRYPEPSDVLGKPMTLEVSRTSENESQWRKIVELLIRGMREGGEARRRAANRMSRLVELKVSTEGETVEFGQALWDKDQGDRRDLPTGTDIFDWAFMVLPEPRIGLAEERFRTKWLNQNTLDESDRAHAGKVLWEVGAAIGNLAVHGIRFSLSEEEERYLANVVKRWSQEVIPVPLPFAGETAPMFANNADEDVRKAIVGLQHVLLEIDVPADVAHWLFEKYQKLNLSEMPARGLSVGLVNALPERLENIVQTLRTGLASDDPKTTQDATNALDFWLKAAAAKEEDVVRMPIDLVQEVGVIIATRRKAALPQAILLAKWVVENGSAEQVEAMGTLALQGIDYLTGELKYDAKRDEDLDVPLLRWACTNLAISMAQRDWADEPAVIHWVENAVNDPLPEVRSVSNQ